jgi:hypothetical protein
MPAYAIICDLTPGEANDLYVLADNVGQLNEDAVLRRSLLTAADRITAAIVKADSAAKSTVRILLTPVQAYTLQALTQNVAGATDDDDLRATLTDVHEKLTDAFITAALRAAQRSGQPAAAWRR